MIPCNRAAHASTKIEKGECLMFGGALVGGNLAKEQLYHLKIDGNKAIWNELQINGKRPGKRYGHTLCFSKPNVILFGGSTGNETINETWILDLLQNKFQWTKIENIGEFPPPRVYHSADLCRFGGATGMMIIFGGRDTKGNTCKEIWGLRKHRNGTWDWTIPPKRNDEDYSLGRYQHKSIFYGSLMFNIGGKINERICNNLFSVYDYEQNTWYTANGVECFRHVCWIHQNKLYIHGGLDNQNKILGGGVIQDFDLLEVFKDYPELTHKIKSFSDIFSNQLQQSPLSPQPAPAQSQLENLPKKKTIKVNNLKTKSKIEVMLKPKKKVEKSLADFFIENLLLPNSYCNLPADAEFQFTSDQIIQLCELAENIIKNQPVLIRVESPTKIFGDIHGQYSDLMRFFQMLGAPCNPEVEDGLEEEDNYSYVFLGDYVDRGNHSLETMCLLLALKVKFPDKIYLLRGNHEDRWINQSFGFFDECEQRLGENSELPSSVFHRINTLFEYMPLAGIIDETILCIHGGIGSSLKKIEQIESIERPLEVIHEVESALEKLVVDILWSDPTDDDSELGVQPNHVRDPHGTGNIVKYGPDVVKDFLVKNNLSKIIRAHECVMDGFERFSGGDLITVFSATDYCGKHKNAGAVLIITKNFEISPKLIYPTMNQSNWIDENDNGYRPPTPPRYSGSPQPNY